MKAWRRDGIFKPGREVRIYRMHIGGLNDCRKKDNCYWMCNKMSKTKDLFTRRSALFLSKQTKLDKYADRLSNWRLAAFIAGLLLTAAAFVYIGKTYGYIILGISLFIFIGLVIRHDKIIREADKFCKLAAINQRCLQRIKGEWTVFPDDGQEFADPNHPYANDLNIFGPASLFQWINTANTWYGRQTLGNWLENPRKDAEHIKKKQGAVRELASKLEFCQGLQCEGLACEGIADNPAKLLAYAEDGAQLFKFKFSRIFFYVLPGITILSLGLLFWYESLWYVPLLCIFIQILVNGLGTRKVNHVLAAVYTNQRKIAVYQRLLVRTESEKFSDVYLHELQAGLLGQGETASKQIDHLGKIADAAGLRLNPLIHVVINNVLFWDYHCAFSLEKWKKLSGSSLRKWIATLGRFEALSSLALIAQLNPAWCYPEVEEKGPFMAAREMGHPLICEAKRVPNQLVIDNQIGIITGSNMSGKTTLLRTAGINLVLAYAGAPVCAKEFRCSLMDIFTSMNISDDLNRGISTFYAELLRIKMIIDHARQNQPMLFLIDEVFRGTNSRDRVTGARSVVMNLNHPWIIGLISTHDFELCDFENDPSGRIVNYHFTETYSENEIHFDYKLRAGRCKTANARYLMKMVGIELMENDPPAPLPGK